MTQATSAHITSAAGRLRQSNFELLRILAMFMVLSVHANFRIFGAPTELSIAESPLNSAVRCLLEALAIGSVNFFIFISGWFGIHASLRGFLNFFFQVVFIYGLCFVLSITLDSSIFSLKTLASVFCIGGNGWFIISYSILFIIAPALNAYLDTADRKSVKRLLIGFFIFQSIWGFFGNVAAFGQGYSPVSFIGIYLLSGYTRRYREHASTTHIRPLIEFLCISVILAVAMLIVPQRAEWLMYYDNPLIIYAAFSLTCFFADLKIPYNRVINFIASSAFAVYLFHSSPFVFNEIFIPLISKSNIVAIIGILIGFYMAGLVIDQPRKLTLKMIDKVVDRCSK